MEVGADRTTVLEMNDAAPGGTRDLDAAVADMLDFFDRFDMEKYGTDGAPLHDPCVIAYLLEPDLFAGRRCHVAVATDEGPTIGMTLVDWWDVVPDQPNATVMRDMDSDRFFALLVERIGRLA